VVEPPKGPLIQVHDLPVPPQPQTNTQQNYQRTQQSTYQQQPHQQQTYQQDAGEEGVGWLVAGYIFALLGGLIGLILGAYLSSAKTVVNGQKIHKYKKSTRNQGIVIIVVSILTWIIYMSIYA
jgi:hypothetical protein